MSTVVNLSSGSTFTGLPTARAASIVAYLTSRRRAGAAFCAAFPFGVAMYRDCAAFPFGDALYRALAAFPFGEAKYRDCAAFCFAIPSGEALHFFWHWRRLDFAGVAKTSDALSASSPFGGLQPSSFVGFFSLSCCPVVDRILYRERRNAAALRCGRVERRHGCW